jgi:hypothetical protein
VFSGVTLNGSDQVDVITTLTSFTATTDPGNGAVIARRADNNQVWIVTWDAGQTFYGGAPTAGGPRMYFAAGAMAETGGPPDGTYNLNSAGQTMFLNAVAWYIDPSANHAPIVDAGIDQSLIWPENTAAMDATVSDDGLPDPPSLTYTWSKLSGSGTVSFSPNAGSLNPTVTFSEPDTYELQLDAFDGEKHGTDTVIVNVTDMSGAMVYTGPINLTHSVMVKSRVLNDSGEWSALNEVVFGTDSVAEYLRISEIMYHPEETGNPDDPNEEYIELVNIGPSPINLNLARFTNGIDFTFGDVELGAGEYVVVVRNAAAFGARYPAFTGVIAGQYSGSLDNGGERIELVDALGQSILNFKYKDGWRSITDGLGHSLTIVDAANPDPNSWGRENSWRASAYVGGSPGYDDGGIIPNPGDIVINEVLAHSHGIEADWIEFYNTTGSQIDIGGWYLSDSEEDLKKYRFADGTKIDGYDYLVLYQDANFGNFSSDPGKITGFAFSENGDQAYLSSAENGILTGYRAVEDFGASYTGISFGRYYKSSTESYNFVPMDHITPKAANAYPAVGPIVISEIMYNPDWPAGGMWANDRYEYIELHNITDLPVKLYRDDKALPWKFSEGVEYVFPDFPNEATIWPHDYVVVVRDVSAFTWRYPGVPSEKILGPYEGQLDNAGERVEISMPGDVDMYGKQYYIRIDRVTYSDGAHPGDEPGDVDLWPTEADGGGKSLTRTTPNLYGNDPNNWTAESPSPGGT